MKKTVLTLILTLCFAFAALAFAVNAESALQLTVANGGDYATVESALTAVEALAKNGKLNEKGVVLVLSGEHTATVKNGVLFGQKTIFLPNGKKLPITVKGSDATLHLPAGNVACANDYTFDSITVPFDDVATNLFAGSGNVTLGKIDVDLNGTEEFKSRFYGDNFTAAVFEGWTEFNLNCYRKNGLFYTSMTLGDGFDYRPESSVFAVAAVGSDTDFSASVGSKTVSADDIRAELIVDGATLTIPVARSGKNPAGNSVLHVKSGSVFHLYGNTKNSSVTEYVGNVTVIVDGGSLTHFVRILQSATLKGNLSVTLRNVNLLANPDTEDAQMIEIGFSGSSVIGDVTVYLDNVKADRYYGSMGGKTCKVTGDVSFTAKNCEFSKFIYSGFGQTPIYGNVTNTLENVSVGPKHFYGLDECPLLGNAAEYTGSKSSVGNLTNTLKNVTFAGSTGDESCYLASKAASFTAEGDLTSTLENVTTQGKLSLYLANYAGTVKGSITNTVKSGTYNHYVYGGPYKGTVKGNLINYVQGGTYFQEVFLGGYTCTVEGKIENRVSGGAFDTLYLYCGPRSGKVTHKGLPYGIENYFTGGSFVGVWGGGGNATAGTLKANIYNEISDGYFGVYNNSGKNNSFAGSTRNGAHEGRVDTLIRGGTFTGYVFGGSIPNQEDWSHQHKAVSNLTLAGGDFRYIVSADCRWGNYDETHLTVNTEKALQPLSIAYDMECEAFIAANDAFPSMLTKEITCKELIARGKAPLQVFGTARCDSFTVEDGAASPEVYHSVITKSIDAGDTPLTLGAKGKVTTDEVKGGAVAVHQSEYWLARTYFTSPASTEITLSQGEKVYGEVLAKDGVVKGESSVFEGVSFVFDEKIALRFYFNKEWVDQSKDDFRFRAAIGDRDLVKEIGFDGLTLTGSHYSVLSDYLSATELCSTVTASGDLMETRSFTLLELAENGIRIYGKDGQSKELGDLLKAFSNYAVATDNYKNGNDNPLPYGDMTFDTGFTGHVGFAPLVASPLLNITAKQLVLDDGMRIRYHLRSVSLDTAAKTKVQNMHYFFNCVDVTNKVTKTWKSSGFNKGYYEITVDLPVPPSESKDHFRFIVAEKDDLHDALPADSTEPYTTYVHVDYVDRLDSIAQELSEGENGTELGKALLGYLQTGAAYYKTQPDISEFGFPTEFSAGYAREDFSPYGYDMDMYSGRNGCVVLDPMCVTCIALWDGDELALIYSLDFRGSSATFTAKYKDVLKNELKDLIDTDKIFFNATHDHSGPNASSPNGPGVKIWYETIFDDAFMMATKKAILDLAPTKLYTGKAMSDQGTNFVRRYVRNNTDGKGEFTGIHNIVPTTNIIGYETEADKELRTMRFVREGKKDIVYANWQGHAAHGAAYRYQFTADFIHWMREGVEKELDVHFMYANGASGNLNFTAKLNDTPFTSPYFSQVGKSLVGTVKKSVAADHEIQTGDFKITYIPFLATVKHEDADTVERAKAANEILKAYKAEHGSDMPAKQIQEQTGFQSKYEISHIITRSGMGETGIIGISAFSFGDVGMTFVPFEQFDSNAKQTRDGVADLYEVVFTAAYSNGSHSYIPSAYAAPHGGYEVYSSRYVDSTGDDIAFALRDALRAMKNN